MKIKRLSLSLFTRLDQTMLFIIIDLLLFSLSLSLSLNENFRLQSVIRERDGHSFLFVHLIETGARGGNVTSAGRRSVY